MRRTVIIDDGRPDPGEPLVHLVGLRDHRYLYAVVVDGGDLRQVTIDRGSHAADEAGADCDCGHPGTCHHVDAVSKVAAGMLGSADGSTGSDGGAARFVDTGQAQELARASGAGRLPSPEEQVDRFLGAADPVQLQHLVRRMIRESPEAFRVAHDVALESTTSNAADRMGAFRAGVDDALGGPGLLESTDVFGVAEELTASLQWAPQLIQQDPIFMASELRRLLELLRSRVLQADDPGGELQQVCQQAVELYAMATRYTCVSADSRRELGRWIVDFSRRVSAGAPSIALASFVGTLGVEGRKTCGELLDRWQHELGREASTAPGARAALAAALAAADERMDRDVEDAETLDDYFDGGDRLSYGLYESAWHPTGWSIEPEHFRVQRMLTELRLS